MLEKILKRASWSDIIVSIIFIVFGVMLVTNPGTIISMLSVILGGIFVAIGAFKVIEYFSKGKEDSYLLGIGVAAILLGIVLMFCTGTILSIFRIVIGVWIIYTGIMNLNTAIQWKDLQSRLWLLTVIFSILVVIGGIYILANSGAILETIGVLIIIYGVMDIIERLIFMKKYMVLKINLKKDVTSYLLILVICISVICLKTLIAEIIATTVLTIIILMYRKELADLSKSVRKDFMK